MSSTGVYFYAISRGLTAEDVKESTGIAGAPLRLVEHEDLRGVVSDVDLDEFGEEGLRQHLEDLAWLESVATAHDRVARVAAEHAPTAPLRLATVFLGDDSVREQLVLWRDAASQALDRVEGRSEWSVKAYADPAGRPTTPEAEASSTEGVGAGKAYLLKRREATRLKEEQARADAEIAEEFHAMLQGCSVMSRRLAAQDRRLTGHTGEMILNGTYLVDQAQVDRFKEVVDRLAGAHAHVRVQLAGPWPPYSFATLDTG